MANYPVILLGAGLAWCVADLCKRMERIDRRPFGPVMCKQLCDCFKGDFSPVYDAVRLSCLCNSPFVIQGITDDECSLSLGNKMSSAKCPSPFTFHRAANFCFYVYKKQRPSMYSAQRACLRMSGKARLAVVNTPEKLKIIKEIYTELRNEDINTYLWVGAKFEENKGFRWSDGSSIQRTLWVPGEPNNQTGKERCVNLMEQLLGENSFFGVNDATCSCAGHPVCDVPI